MADKKTDRLLVRFSVAGTEIKGDVVWAPEGIAHKRVFVEGYWADKASQYRGVLPGDGEAWVCAFVRDTQPGVRKGAIIVRVEARPTWDWVPTGKEALLGAKEFAPRCKELPELPNYHASSAVHNECEMRNAAFKAAQERSRRFQNTSWVSPSFLAEFGTPTVTVEGDNFVLAFIGFGTKTIDIQNAAELFPTTFTGEWREGSGSIEAARRFDEFPMSSWVSVAYTGHTPSVWTKAFDLLPAGVQEGILALLRTKIRSPEKVAADRFASFVQSESIRAGRLAEIRNELRGLLGPFSSLHVVEERVQGGDVLSPDERGWRSTSWMSYTLVAMAYPSERSWHLGRPTTMAEVSIHGDEIDFPRDNPLGLRDLVVARLRRNLREEFDGELKRFKGPELDARIFGDLSSDEWVARHAAEWTRLVDVWIAAAEAEDAPLIAAAHAEWQRYEEAVAELRQLREQGSAVVARIRDHRVEVETFHDGRTIGDATLDELQSAVAEWRNWIETAEEAISSALRARGEAEIAAASKEAAKAAFDAAMSAPATPARWFVGEYFDLAKLETSLGRKCGEGLGLRVARSARFLPGDRGLVALRLTGGTRRYGERLVSEGLASLYGGDLPTSVPSRDSIDFVGIIESPDWYIASTQTHDGEPYRYSLVSASGFASLSPGSEGFESSFSCRSWDGIEDVGPTELELRKAHGLSRKVPTRREPESLVAVTAPDVLDEPPTSAPVAEPPPAIFTLIAKRDFRCPKGHSVRLTSSEYAQYQNGASVPIACTVCSAKGLVQK